MSLLLFWVTYFSEQSYGTKYKRFLIFAYFGQKVTLIKICRVISNCSSDSRNEGFYTVSHLWCRLQSADKWSIVKSHFYVNLKLLTSVLAHYSTYIETLDIWETIHFWNPYDHKQDDMLFNWLQFKLFFRPLQCMGQL